MCYCKYIFIESVTILFVDLLWGLFSQSAKFKLSSQTQNLEFFDNAIYVLLNSTETFLKLNLMCLLINETPV